MSKLVSVYIFVLFLLLCVMTYGLFCAGQYIASVWFYGLVWIVAFPYFTLLCDTTTKLKKERCFCGVLYWR